MDGEGQAPEDLSVSLSWPGDDQEEPHREPTAKEPASNDPPPESGPRGLWRRRGPAAPSHESSATPSDTPPVPPTPAPPVPAARQPAPSVGGSDASLARRIDELVAGMASTTGRIDTLTDAVVTLRGFVNERMGDVGDAVTRSQTQITREVGDALDRAQSQITRELDEALAHLPAATTPDFGEALERVHLQITQDLERTFARIHGQTTKHLDEALIEARSQSTRDLVDATTEAQAETARQLTAGLDRLESQTTRRGANDDRRYEQTAAAMKAAVAATEDGVRRIDRVGSAISTELATIGQRVTDQVEVTSTTGLSELAALGEHLSARIDGVTETSRADLATATRRLTNEVLSAVTATGTESREHAERVSADISGLSESVADALTQVAERLEQLALNNHGQQDVVEAVAQALDDVAARLDDLDSTNRSRHERTVAAIADLRSKRSQPPPVDLGPVTSGLDRVETFVEALVDAADDRAGTRDTLIAAVERLEGLQTTIADQLDQAASRAIGNLTDAAERAANQIKTAVPPVTERSTLAAMTRIEGRMAEMSRQREEHDEAAQEALDAMEATVGRLASAQAEDLERILDTVENTPAPPDPATLTLSAADAERLARIEDEIRKLSRQPRATSVSPDIDGTALEQMASLGNQIDALRRRMAVRARPQAPTFDAEALDAIAEAVAARLATTSSPGPTNAAVKRSPRKSATPRKSTSPRRKPEQ